MSSSSRRHRRVVGETSGCRCGLRCEARATNAHTHTHPFNVPLSWTTWVGQYQKGKTNLDFTGARDSEWQWHQLGHMQVCTSHQTDNHASTPPLSFLPAGCPSCRPTNSVKALKAIMRVTLMPADLINISRKKTAAVSRGRSWHLMHSQPHRTAVHYTDGIYT